MAAFCVLRDEAHAALCGERRFPEGFPRAVGERRGQKPWRRWQVFGLTSTAAKTAFLSSRFPGQAQCSVSLVLAYRCGAAPDFHQVPL